MRAYSKVILMADFMTHLADRVWPKGKRYGTKEHAQPFALGIVRLVSVLLQRADQREER